MDGNVNFKIRKFMQDAEEIEFGRRDGSTCFLGHSAPKVS